MSKIRRTVFDDFGHDRVAINRPNATLEEVLVPIYLSDRFQMETVVKSLGGVDYAYTS